jgi:two-component system NtrC family sensor kinase
VVLLAGRRTKWGGGLSSSSSVVRIAVIAPPGGAAPTPTLDALRRLGGEVEIDVVREPAACLALDRRAALDLVVTHRLPHAAIGTLCQGLRTDGPPLVSVTGPDDDAEALAAFRAGARDCVRLGADLPDALSVVALEEIGRYRQQRERAWLSKRIGELQRYNENIIQNLNSAVIVVDPDGIITYANPTAGAILEGPAEPLVELEGRSVWGWFPGVRERDTRIGQTLEHGVRCQGAETQITRLDGTRVPIGISCAPLLGDDGAQQGAVATFQDLSEIGQLREQVLQSEKMASIGELAAGVAHEINNPTGFIHANLYQMTEYLADLESVWSRVRDLSKAVEAKDWTAASAASSALIATSEEVDVEFVLSDLGKAVRESQEGSERIRHIVQDLRDFARQDTGERTPADLNQCVDSTASIAWTMMKHSVVLTKEYGEIPTLSCFPMQLKQVVMNLLVNAYQAIEQKYGESGQVGHIVVRTRSVDDGVMLEIEDDGVGICEDHRGRIFDPFFTTKEVGAGTGLGLSTSYSIVRRHGGTMTVDSQAGEGARFRVWLPLEPAEPDA